MNESIYFFNFLIYVKDYIAKSKLMANFRDKLAVKHQYRTKFGKWYNKIINTKKTLDEPFFKIIWFIKTKLPISFSCLQ